MRRAVKQGIQKRNNKGLSLVEVLVAVIIMAVVSIVFLRSFSYSMLINRDAKVRQDGLTFAQSLMEGVKAYDVQKLDAQFNGGTLTIFDTGSGSSHSMTEDTTTGERTYTINNAVFEKNTFNAEITLTPTSQKGYMVTIPDFNKYTDAYLKLSELDQDTVKSAIQAKLNNAGYTGAWNASKVTITKRELEIKVTNDGSGDLVNATSTYYYEASGFQKPSVANPSVMENIPTITDKVEITYPANNVYMNNNKAELESLYIFYYPEYNESVGGLSKCNEDVITITNNTNGCSTLKNIYLIKQARPGFGTNDLKKGEADYEAKLTVDATASSEKANFYTNIAISLTDSGTPKYDANTTNCNPVAVPWVDDTQETVLLYDVVVKVTNTTNSEVVCELTGSTNAKRAQ
ncbi:MAG: prepilin-type N-terminal cleavage/methylation domain-containing protein [Lachnospiraceae bacterium]|nr:prepilin-type N-terminal cleavage/methylation domain-containing protein [Lachnospiraceae bacterium]